MIPAPSNSPKGGELASAQTHLVEETIGNEKS